MNEIERKALALLNDVLQERDHPEQTMPLQRDRFTYEEALCRAIEQHEAFRQEVSDAVEYFMDGPVGLGTARERLGRFIIAKPDPLVEALGELADRNMEAEQAAETLRAAIEARGGRIVWEGE